MLALVRLFVMSASTSGAGVNHTALQAAADSQVGSTAALPQAHDPIQRGTAANLSSEGSMAPESAAASKCVTNTKWRNWRSDTCSAYEWKGYCAGGRVLNTSMSGPTSGYPEWACCACNYRTKPSPNSGVYQVLFYATHKLEHNDRMVLDRYSKELSAMNGQAQVWALLMLEARWPAGPLAAVPPDRPFPNLETAH